MFNKNELSELGELIVYVNLLLAILAVIALHDRSKVEDQDEEENEEKDKKIADEIARLNLRVAELEQKTAELISFIGQIEKNN